MIWLLTIALPLLQTHKFTNSQIQIQNQSESESQETKSLVVLGYLLTLLQ